MDKPRMDLIDVIETVQVRVNTTKEVVPSQSEDVNSVNVLSFFLKTIWYESMLPPLFDGNPHENLTFAPIFEVAREAGWLGGDIARIEC